MTRGAVANGGVSPSIASLSAADDLEVERLADSARLLRPVEHGDCLDCWRQGREELCGREWMEEADPHQPDPLAGRVECVDRLLDRARRRAHDDRDAVRVRGAVVVDEPIPPAGPRGEFVHYLLDDAGHGAVEQVRGLAALEEDVGVLRGAADHGGIGRHAPAAEGEHVVVADQRPEVVGFEQRDLVDLVRGSEAVEEVEERDPGPERRGVGHQREVVGLLDRPRREHRPAGRPRVHDVAVVAEDR